jgi:photosystem II stability/assembly factor-like uncharacterized protein
MTPSRPAQPAPLMRSALAALLGGTLALSACVKAPDFGPVQAERAKPVQRHDTFQSAASNGKVLVAGTSSGAIVMSGDAGKSWTRHTLAGPSSVMALAACPDGSFVGIDFYRKLWIGDAAGQQWKSLPLDKDVDPMALTCDGAGRVWVSGSHTTILSSSDRGASWSKVDFGEDAILTTIQFVDDKHGFVTGEFGTVLTTADGGTTWTPQPAIPGDFYPYSTVFFDAQKGWSTGIGGVLLHTADGGKSWTPQPNPSGAPMYALLRQGDELYGLGAGGQMVVQKGEAWERFDHGLSVPAYLTSGAVLDGRSMLVAGAAGALHVVTAPGRMAFAAALEGVQR